MQIELVQPAQESRWPTSNTRLAAALLVYGYKLCTDQPFIRVFPADKPEKFSTSIWFQDAHPAGVTESIPQDWEVAWIDWQRFKAGQGRYVMPPDWREPLVIMRRALEARQDFLGNINGRAFKKGEPPLRYQACDLVEAICLHALGLRAYEAGAGGFIFDGTMARGLHQQFIEDGSPCAMQWSKRVILQQEELVRAIRRPETVATIHMKVGSKIALIPANCPPSIREPLVRMLHF